MVEATKLSGDAHRIPTRDSFTMFAGGHIHYAMLICSYEYCTVTPCSPSMIFGSDQIREHTTYQGKVLTDLPYDRALHSLDFQQFSTEKLGNRSLRLPNV